MMNFEMLIFNFSKYTNYFRIDLHVINAINLI